ncbi:pyridoxamine 5'-phosphate oxidase family protein [Micromonospora sp. WMMD1082]|nr:pyridoxamine 5'-phosphate oxidase family protein [Micromonospora sp. WMMD1082]MDG4794291.1 pyridoxamine 5'-phosphate oxidase family protein [Micromonospora sp. WMMD1082]
MISAGVLARLEGERVGWLCTLRPDGSPHLTPVWLLYLGGEW